MLNSIKFGHRRPKEIFNPLEQPKHLSSLDEGWLESASLEPGSFALLESEDLPELIDLFQQRTMVLEQPAAPLPTPPPIGPVPTPTPEKDDFSIQVNFGQGLEGLSTDAANAILGAAEIWEQAITDSTFNGVHNLVIDVTSEYSNESFLAFAGPSDFDLDANGNWMPTLGSIGVEASANIGVEPASLIYSAAAYLNINRAKI